MLYVDDAHGFGVIGERDAGRAEPVRHARQQHRPLLRRVVRPHRARRRLLEVVLVARRVRRLPDRPQGAAEDGRPAVPLLRARRRSPRSRPCSPASTSTRRAATRFAPTSGERPTRCSQCLDRLGVHTPNRSGFPIIEVPLARHEDIDAAGRFLFDHGIYVTLAAYPLVPKSEVGFRIQVTAANTQAEIEQLVDVLGKLANAFDLRPAGPSGIRGVSLLAAHRLARPRLGRLPRRRRRSSPRRTSGSRRSRRTAR